MKTEEEVYNEVIAYINSGKYKRPCTLQTIKRELRSSRIVELIFSHPRVFIWDNEIMHVPQELRTEELLMTYVLEDPKRLEKIPEEEQTLPLLIAFEFSKRRYELASARMWGHWRERLEYIGKSKDYRANIIKIADEIERTCKWASEETPDIDLIEAIKSYCRLNDITLEKSEPYTRKYNIVDFGLDKRLVILVSGHPDSGKTTFSRMLSESIIDSKCFDSDMLMERDLLLVPFDKLAGNKSVIVFSDIDADRFFSSEELKDCYVINVYVQPISVQEMYRHSKYMRHLTVDEYLRAFSVETKPNPERYKDAIIVANNYTSGTYKEVDRAIDEIAERLGVSVKNKRSTLSGVYEDIVPGYDFS